MATVVQLAAKAAKALQQMGLDAVVLAEPVGSVLGQGRRDCLAGTVLVDMNWCGLALRWKFSFSGPGVAGPNSGTAAPEVDLAVPVTGPTGAAKPLDPMGPSSRGEGATDQFFACAWDSPRAMARMGSHPPLGTSEIEAAYCLAELQAWSVEALCEWDGRDEASLAQLVTELVAAMSSSHADFAKRVLPGAAAGVKSLSPTPHHVLTVDDGASGSRVVVRCPIDFHAGPEATAVPGLTRASVEVAFQAKGAAAAAEGDDGVRLTTRIVGPSAMSATSAIVLPPLLMDESGDLKAFVATASKRVVDAWESRREFCKAMATLASGSASVKDSGRADTVTGPGVLAWDSADWSRVSVPVRAVEGTSPGAWVPVAPLMCTLAAQADSASGEGQAAAFVEGGASAEGTCGGRFGAQPDSAAKGTPGRVAAVLSARLSSAFPAEAPSLELRSVAPADDCAFPSVVRDSDAPIAWAPDGVRPAELALRVALHTWTAMLPRLACKPT